ncbi:MAG TPA: response regulator transcription factor [Thermoleophilaceae bacterium]|nr:response regulator transcription factor [Thermoleophilaceae bacterium]
MSGILRVLVADDHAPTRDDVRTALERDGGFEVCSEAPDAARAIADALRERPDICLLDVHMPGNGIAATWEIVSRLPSTKVVMLTVSEEDADLFAALQAGAVSYLLKDIDLRILPDALRDVWSGQASIPGTLVARMVERFHGGEARRRAIVSSTDERLTSREWQVLALLAEGMSTQQIAQRLVLSASAVRAHISALVRKLGVSGRDEAIALFHGRS